jgi:hypothetical protein
MFMFVRVLAELGLSIESFSLKDREILIMRLRCFRLLLKHLHPLDELIIELLQSLHHLLVVTQNSILLFELILQILHGLEGYLLLA